MKDKIIIAALIIFITFSAYAKTEERGLIAAGDNAFVADSLKKAFNDEKKALQLSFEKDLEEVQSAHFSRNLGINIGLAGALSGFIFVTFAFYRQIQKTKKLNAVLEDANNEIKKTQEQLIRSEKLAAYGVMASRMAHEIQNPLNFVNNFSALSETLLKEVITATNDVERSEAANILLENIQKISHHGKRAEAIVRQLEEHNRAGTAHEYFENEKI